MKKLAFFCAALSWAAFAQDDSKDVLTNSVLFKNPPKWFSTYKAQSAIDKAEQKLEWSTDRVTATFYATQGAFDAVLQHPGGKTIAVTRAAEKKMFLGPRVTKDNLAMVLTHEMTHVILQQKYKGRVPAWLEEGMANFTANNVAIDYNYLAGHTRMNITQLSHPLDAKFQDEIDFKYQASLGVILMLKEKCPDFRELLNLSLKENLEAFVPTYCQIPNLNDTFWQWVDKKKGSSKWVHKAS